MNTIVNERKRARSTKKQIDTMVDYILENMPMVDRDSCPYDTQWEDLKNVLNNMEKGPKKNVKEWKKVFKELKTNVRRRAREVKTDLQRTGGGTSNVKPLTEVEEKVLLLIAKVTVEGSDAVVEFGICNKEETDQVEPLMEVSNVDNIVEEDDMNVDVEIVTPPPQVSQLQSTPSTSGFQRIPANRRKTRTKQQTMLETAIQRQAEASQALAESVNNLSSSIRFLGESISNAFGK